jgi:outer membrane protein, multidrug efflux system
MNGTRMGNNNKVFHAAEMNLAQCFYGVETARSKFYPSITISGTGAFTNSGGAGIVNPGKWLLSAVGSLTQPIFQNGRIIAGLKVAKMQYEQAYNTWQNAVLKAGSEVSNALVLYNYSDEKSKIEQKRIEVLEKNVESTKELMGIAGSSYLEIIQAQSSLLNVQLSKVADERHWHTAPTRQLPPRSTHPRTSMESTSPATTGRLRREQEPRRPDR